VASKAYALRGNPERGATEIAPTAPHATPHAGADKSGPARFWATRALRTAGVIALAASLVAHGIFTPWELLPKRSGVKFKDVEGELTIPIDLLGEEAPPPPPPPTETHETPNEKDTHSPLAHKPDASAPKHKLDAGADASLQATDAGADAGVDAGASGPRDPGSMIGMAGLVTAGQVNVTLLVNVAVIRKNSVGARMGPLLMAIPQWQEFMRGSETAVDPIRDTDWILIYGPSLIHTDRDAVLVRYSVSDELVDDAIDAIAANYKGGGAFDAGVPGVKSSLGHADNAERVFLRVQPHVLVVVPKDKANEFARVLKRAPVSPRVRPGEAMRLTVKDPWKQVVIPGLKFDKSLSELRLWIVPRASDGGADVFAEGDCTDEAAAADTANVLTDLIARQNSSAFVRIATRGLLNGARVVADGTLVKLHISASRDQLESVFQTAGAFLGAAVEPPPGAPPR